MFNAQNTQSLEGFRLKRLEVFNWGTFSGIHVMELNGRTALLTGANGSGKSTLVDALITLLIPHRKRGYNLAAGTAKKSERDEKTYVEGYYGRIRDEEGGAKIQRLRTGDTYTVILGVFENLPKGQIISLAQVMWPKDNKIAKIHVVAPRDLNIADHINFTGDISIFRKHIKPLGGLVELEFPPYFKHLQERIGVRSEKALDLFNQIVSIKEIGNLTQFVRENMLERQNIETEINRLREQYQNLTEAHRAIRQASDQLKSLKPILEDAEKYQTIEHNISETNRLIDALPFFFAGRELGLRTETEVELEQQQVIADDQLRRIKARLEEYDINRDQLQRKINADEAGRREAELQDALRKASLEQKDRKDHAIEYDKIARDLNLSSYDGQLSTYHHNRKQAEQIRDDAQHKMEQHGIERDTAIQAQGLLQTQVQDNQTTLDDLRKRRTQIPAEDVRIRQQMAQKLGINENELPFIGELLQVRADEHPWRGALERLLGGFARQMIVPDALYGRVRHYVNQTHLRGRLTYHRVNTELFKRRETIPPNTVPSKLEIHPQTPFAIWLNNQLLRNYPHQCCTTPEEFDQYERAITIQGQTKNGERHEKDDRRTLDDRSHDVLGWDNTAKQRAVEEKLTRVKAELADKNRQIQTLNQSIQGQQRQRDVILNFLSGFSVFEAIDWYPARDQIENLQKQIVALRQNSDQLNALRQELEALNKQIAQEKSDSSKLERSIGAISDKRERNKIERDKCERSLVGASPELAVVFPGLEKRIKSSELTLENLRDHQESIRQSLQASFRTHSANLGKLSEKIVQQMTEFRSQFTQAGLNLGQDTRAIAEYRKLFHDIEKHDMPRHEQRFQQLLNRQITDAFVAFRQKLRQDEKSIIDSLENLNQALKTIRYTENTYIRLQADRLRDVDIAEFRRDLEDAVHYGDESQAGYQARFERIQALIKKFDEPNRWTQKVSDVRQWFEFSAEERRRSDNEIKETYNDTTGKSGGQKAKLAYTIMASALAYQYGLDDQNRRADGFRFVVVDEAFSKSDEENAHYAMRLFEELGLQLLVITPRDKINIVEPFIESCHLTVNNDRENSSYILSMTLQELQQQTQA